MKLTDKLGLGTYGKLVADLRKRVLEESEDLLLSGTATFDVVYRVSATVTLDFSELEAASSVPVLVDSDDEKILIFANRTEDREPVDGSDIEEIVRDNVYYDIPEDLDDYRVNIDDVELDDYDLTDVDLDPGSAEKLRKWNGQEEE